jgi:type VI secretion system protein ImpA
VSSPAVLDIDSLILPISEANPTGDLLPDGKRLELDELRKEPDPLDPATANRNPDWGKLVKTTSEILTKSSKDLQTAVRLVEAATKKAGIPGLRDGLRLLHRLVTDCWDRMHPIPMDGEGPEVREGPMKWLNDVSRGAKFPQTIREQPLVKTSAGTFSCTDWLRPERKAEFEEAIPTTDGPELRRRYEDLIESREALQSLAKVLDEKMGADVAPDFLNPETSGNIGTALGQCIDLVTEVAKRRGVALTDTPAAEESTTEAPAQGATTTAVASGPVGVAGSREGLYRQLEQIAMTLKRIEPHSPIPFLLERCVRLGRLPFPELMRAIIQENTTLDELDRLLGIAKPSE